MHCRGSIPPQVFLFPSLPIHSFLTPIAMCPTDQLLQHKPQGEQLDHPRQQRQHDLGRQPMQRSDSGGTPASMPADSSPQPLPARSIDGRQEQHAQRKIAEAARVAHRPFRPPLKILQRSSRDERMPSQKVLGVVQRPGSHQQQGWAPATDQPTHIPLSHMQIGHVPLPPTDPVPSAPYMPAPGNQQSPAPGPFQQHRPQPQEGKLSRQQEATLDC